MRRSVAAWARVAVVGLLAAAACDGGSRASPPATAPPATATTRAGPVEPAAATSSRTPTFQPVSPIVYAPSSGQVVGVAAGRDALWAIQMTNEAPTRGHLVRLDAMLMRPTLTTPLGDRPIAVAAGPDLVWVLTSPSVADVRLLGIDPGSGRVVIDAALPGPVRGEPPFAHLAAGDDAVWVAVKESTGGHRLLRIDSRSGRVAATVPLSEPPTAIALGQRLWIGTERGRLLAVDRTSNLVTADLPLGGLVLDLAVDQQSGWVTVRTPGGVVDLVRFDQRSPDTLTRTGIPVAVVEAGRNRVWVGNYGYPPPAQTGFLGEVDTRTNTLGQSTSLPTVSSNGVADIVIGDGVIWALNTYASTLTAIRPPT